MNRTARSQQRRELREAPNPTEGSSEVLAKYNRRLQIDRTYDAGARPHRAGRSSSGRHSKADGCGGTGDRRVPIFTPSTLLFLRCAAGYFLLRCAAGYPRSRKRGAYHRGRLDAAIRLSDARRVDIDMPLLDEHGAARLARRHFEVNQNGGTTANRHTPLIGHGIVMAVGGAAPAIIAVVGA